MSASAGFVSSQSAFCVWRCRLKRPVGRRLAVAAAALLHPGTGGSTLRAGLPLTGPTIAGCSVLPRAGAPAASEGTSSSSELVLAFNASLLAGDELLARMLNTGGVRA